MAGRLCPCNHPRSSESGCSARPCDPGATAIPRPPRSASSGAPRVRGESSPGELDVIRALLCGLQRQCDDDRSRLALLERKAEAWSVNGRLGFPSEQRDKSQRDVRELKVQVQDLALRLEGLDKHVSARDVTAKLSSQQLLNLELSVSLMERQVECASMLAKEAHSFQSATEKHALYAVEEMAQRLSRVEEHVRFEIPIQGGVSDQCVSDMEKWHHEMEHHVGALLASLEERMLDSDGNSEFHTNSNALHVSQRESTSTTQATDLRARLATPGKAVGIFPDGAGANRMQYEARCRVTANSVRIMLDDTGTQIKQDIEDM